MGGMEQGTDLDPFLPTAPLDLERSRWGGELHDPFVNGEFV